MFLLVVSRLMRLTPCRLLLYSTLQEGLHRAWLGYAFYFEDFNDR